MTQIRIHSCVPFADAIYWSLRLSGLSLQALAHDRRYDQAYLAWEQVRQRTNPFFDPGTGFEGYLIGLCDSPEQALERLLGTMHGVLDGIARCHPRQYAKQNTLMKTLTGEKYDAAMVDLWSTWLGVVLAKLRCNLFHNKAGDKFRSRTYQLVGGLPPIQYQEVHQHIEQDYCLCAGCSNSRLHVGLPDLNGHDQEAWLVALHLGRFGHPLVRQLLTHSLTGANYPLPRFYRLEI